MGKPISLSKPAKPKLASKFWKQTVVAGKPSIIVEGSVPFPAPPSYKGLESRAIQLGRRLLKDFRSNPTCPPFTPNSHPAGSEAKVRTAVRNFLTGKIDVDRFKDLYRAAWPNSDEHVSTAVVTNLLRGVRAQAKVGLTSAQILNGQTGLTAADIRVFQDAVVIMSSSRFPTSYTGFNEAAIHFQHPTGAGGGEYQDSAGNKNGSLHSKLDQIRANLVLDRIESSLKNGSDLITIAQQATSEAATFSLNQMIAPVGAKNQSSKSLEAFVAKNKGFSGTLLRSRVKQFTKPLVQAREGLKKGSTRNGAVQTSGTQPFDSSYDRGRSTARQGPSTRGEISPTRV